MKVAGFFPVSCHLGPKGPNGKIVLIRFVHVHKKYKTRVSDRQRKSGYCGILAQKVSVRPYARIFFKERLGLKLAHKRITTKVVLPVSRVRVLYRGSYKCVVRAH